MRTFAQKPTVNQQNTSAKSTMPGRAQFGRSREVSSILHLQGTIGNKAVQRLLETNTRNVKGDSTTKTARLGHDFSRIPVHAGARSNIQPKLKVNAPGDQYEQEADRVADQVMKMPDPAWPTQQHSMNVPAPCRTAADKVMRQPNPRETEKEIDIEKRRTMLKLVCPECEDLLQAKEASSEGVRVSTEFEISNRECERRGNSFARICASVLRAQVRLRLQQCENPQQCESRRYCAADERPCLYDGSSYRLCSWAICTVLA